MTAPATPDDPQPAATSTATTTVRRRRLLASAAAGLLATVAAGLLVSGVLSQDPAPPSPDAGAGAPVPATAQPSDPPRSTAPGSGSVLHEGPKGPVMADSAPVRVQVAALGVDSTLERLDLQDNNTMSVPKDPAQAGWFVRSATPGSLGPSVIAGHVTWNQEPSVFFKLGSMKPGQRIDVTRRDGSTAVFEVTKVSQFEKRRFPTAEVYGNVDHSALRLITCGGTYDGSSHRYLDNVVVFAALVRAA